jgi:hypothetical protein
VVLAAAAVLAVSAVLAVLAVLAVAAGETVMVNSNPETVAAVPAVSARPPYQELAFA